MQTREADFDELTEIGKGTFSSVYSCKNKYDEKLYALKKITIKPSRKLSLASSPYGKVIEEVRHLSSFLHPNVVRYYGCWTSVSGESQPSHPKTQPCTSKKGPHSKSQFYEQKRPSALGDQLSSKSGQEKGGFNRLLSENFHARESDCFKDKKGTGSLHFPSYSDVSSEDKVQLGKKKENTAFQEAENLRLSDLLDSTKPFDIITTPIDFYIQTELCQQTLKDYLEERKQKLRENPASQEWIKESFMIAKQLVIGLIYLSSEGIIHRDIKPSNIFLTSDLQVKYGDFGLVKTCAESSLPSFPSPPLLSPIPSEIRKGSCQLESTFDLSEPASGHKRARRYSCWDDDVGHDLTTRIGTTLYASPEQMADNKYTKKADYYSLGLVLLEVFHPMQTEMERLKLFQAVRKNQKIEVELLDGKAPLLGSVIEGLLKLDSSQRTPLDELLAKICAEDLRLRKEMFNELVGPVQFRREGEDTWSEKHLMIAHGKLYIFANADKLKAELQVDLLDFKINVGEPDLFQGNHSKDYTTALISLRNEVVLGFDIKAKEVQASQILAKASQYS
jgi:serine/threonine protein kinase